MLKILIDNYLEGKATPEETDQLNAWYASFDDRKELYAADLPGLAELVTRKFEELKSKLGLG